jgi:SAM-dependent methyltransferase
VRTITPLSVRQGLRRFIYKIKNGPPLSPTLENLRGNTSYFARKYGLNQTKYFENIEAYNADRNLLNDLRPTHQPLARCPSPARFGGSSWANANPEDLLSVNSLTHIAAMDFLLSEVSKDALILDIGCGMGHFFVHLHRFGYAHLTGVDDSAFQPGIIESARDFLNWYETPASLLDFCNIGFHGHYKSHQLYGLFDVVTLFGLRGFCLYELAYDLLRQGGYFIQETNETALGVYSTDFKLVATYPRYGRSNRYPYSTAIYQKLSTSED